MDWTLLEPKATIGVKRWVGSHCVEKICSRLSLPLDTATLCIYVSGHSRSFSVPVLPYLKTPLSPH